VGLRRICAGLACAALLLSTACGRATDAAPGPSRDPVPATVGGPAQRPGGAQASAVGLAPTGATAAPSGVPDTGPEARSATAALGVRVVAIRRESADSVRVELSLVNLADAATWTPESPAAAAVRAAVEALDGASLLSADGRRRVFALRGSTGERVGSPLVVPAPGRSEPLWTLFPASEGAVAVLLPGFEPFPALAVAPRPASR
jgi:hypothetical protein